MTKRLVLGIETSCDETGCGLVDSDYNVRGAFLYSQAQTHARFGGVVPEVAARAHLEKIGLVVESALEKANCKLDDIDTIAFTCGPGLLGPLLVGSSFAQGLARALGKKAMGINHLEGHLASAYLTQPHFEPPFLALLVSGGHTELVWVKAGLQFQILGKTRDDAAGEAFDKCGKILGLGYPAGPEVAALAALGRRDFLKLPRSLMERGNLEFSFSGLKTAALREVEKLNPEKVNALKSDFCASIETAIVDVLIAKVLWAIENTGEQNLVVAGGVAANEYLRKRLLETSKREGFNLVLPDRQFCGDNGVMIASATQKRLQWGLSTQNTQVNPNLTWENGAMN